MRWSSCLPQRRESLENSRILTKVVGRLREWYKQTHHVGVKYVSLQILQYLIKVQLENVVLVLLQEYYTKTEYGFDSASEYVVKYSEYNIEREAVENVGQMRNGTS